MGLNRFYSVKLSLSEGIEIVIISSLPSLHKHACSLFQDIQHKLLHSCCTAEGSIDQVIISEVVQSLFVLSCLLIIFLPVCFSQASRSSMLEYWVYLDNQHNMADCPVTRPITPPATPVTRSTCPFIPVPSPVAASTMSSVINPMASNPMTDTCSPVSSMCSPTSSAWDTLRSTSRSPGCSQWGPVTAAAHLHLLGESLSLIGLHLQETDVSEFN